MAAAEGALKEARTVQALEAMRAASTAKPAVMDVELLQRKIDAAKAEGVSAGEVEAAEETLARVQARRRNCVSDLKIAELLSEVNVADLEAAVKAALVGEKHTHTSPVHECARCGYSGHGHEDDGACRLDLDDLGGEVVLIDAGGRTDSGTSHCRALQREGASRAATGRKADTITEARTSASTRRSTSTTPSTITSMIF